MTTARDRPKLAVWKFASCDGCQLSILDLEDELLTIAEAVEIAYFPEATRRVVPGPYDISLVEGSITTATDARRIRAIRSMSKHLVTIGACATAGGIQALRNFTNVEDFVHAVYARPEYIDTLSSSTAIAQHVDVEFELRGCPVNKYQLLEVVSAFLQDRSPNIPNHTVCIDCKRRNIVCLLVSESQPCLGPVTHAGCGALCPSYRRACYGCFGPSELANTRALGDRLSGDGMTTDEMVRAFRTFNAAAPAFEAESRRREERNHRNRMPDDRSIEDRNSAR